MAELKGKVLAGKILVQPQEAEKKTASGIIIPDSAKEKPQVGKVVLTGADKKDDPMQLKGYWEILFFTENIPELNCTLTGLIIC